MNKIYGLKITGNGKTWMDLFYSTHEKAEEGKKEWKLYYYDCIIEIKEITLDLKKEDFNQFKPKNIKIKVWYCLECGLYLAGKSAYYLTRKELFKNHNTLKKCRWLVKSIELSIDTLKKDGKM